MTFIHFCLKFILVETKKQKNVNFLKTHIFENITVVEFVFVSNLVVRKKKFFRHLKIGSNCLFNDLKRKR